MRQARSAFGLEEAHRDVVSQHGTHCSLEELHGVTGNPFRLGHHVAHKAVQQCLRPIFFPYTGGNVDLNEAFSAPDAMNRTFRHLTVFF